MAELAVRHKADGAILPLTLRDIAMPIFRQRRLGSLIFLGILTGAVMTVLLRPPSYEAEMKILVNRERVDPVVTPDNNSAVIAAAPEVSEQDMNSEVELIKSRDLLEQVVVACGLESKNVSVWEHLEDMVHGTRPAEEIRRAGAVASFQDNLIVDPLKNTALIRVAYASSDPQLSARVLQTLATLYQEKHAAVHRPGGTFSFFDQQTGSYRKELAVAESQLRDFDVRESVVAPATQKELTLTQLSQFEAELEQDHSSAYAASQRALELRTEAANSPERQTTQVRQIDNAQLLAQLEGTLLSLRLKRSDMLMKYAPGYPPVTELETEIDDTEKAIKQANQSPVGEVTTDRAPAQDWVATELAKAESDRAQFDAQAAAMSSVVRHYQYEAQQMDRKESQQDDLVRNVKTAEDNYLLYLRKREEARISDELDSKRIVNVSIAEAATVPALPTAHLGWLLIGGFFTATTGGIGAAYAADRMDSSFRTPYELERYLDLRVLASVPMSATRQ